jgi:hypothetical protein
MDLKLIRYFHLIKYKNNILKSKGKVEAEVGREIMIKREIEEEKDIDI